MKNIFKTIALTAAVVALFASCQHKSEFTTSSAFVLAGTTTISIDEDTTAVLSVTAITKDGIAPVTDVYFEVIEAKGVRGEDYYVEPASGILSFNGEDTEYISILPVPKVAPEGTEVIDTTADYYTGDFTFTIRLKEASNGFGIGGSYSTDVTIVDIDAANAWTEVSTGTYTYGGFYWGGSQSGLTLYQSDVEPTRYKIADWCYTDAFYFTWDKDDTGEVHVEDQFTGTVDSDWGDVWICEEIDYFGDDIGGSYYSNGVFYFDVTWYVSAGYFGYGYETFAMEGSVVPDYSVSVSYNGKYTDADGAAYAIGKVELAEDAAYANVAIFAGKYSDDDFYALLEEEVEYQTVSDTTNNVAFPVEESGTYTIIAISYDEDENAQEYDYDTFKFAVGEADVEETWHEYATGDYEYSLYWKGSDPGLTLWQSDDDETRFKIEHWGYDVDFVFTWDQETDDCYVEDQYTGVYNSNYGVDVYVDEIDDWNGGFAYQSYYEAGTFYFCIVYYGDGGYFGYGYETFTLTAEPTTVSDFVGSYSVTEGSYWYYNYYGNWTDVEWTFVESNDDSKGNVMLTVFDDIPCSPIYATLDEDKGTLTIDDWQYMCDYYGSDLYFAVNSDGDPVTFTVIKDGFVGPLDYYFGEYIDDADDPSWYDTFFSVTGKKSGVSGASTASVKANGTRPFEIHTNIGTPVREVPDLKRVSVNGTKLSSATQTLGQEKNQTVKGQSVSVVTYRQLDRPGAQRLTAEPEKFHKK